MEIAIALNLTVAVHGTMNDHVFVETIVSDNDSTMRSHLRHTTNGGKLPDLVPEPEFKADPSHRIKAMASPIFNLLMNLAENIFTPAEVEESTSNSLRTRVAITAGCQVIGFSTLWSTCCWSLDFELDLYLRSVLR